MFWDKKVAMMKKLITLIVVATMLLCGCSMSWFTGGSGSLSQKLEEVDRAEGVVHEAMSEAIPEPTPEGPDSLSFSQLDPYDMLHYGWTLTKEQARDQYGMTPNGYITLRSALEEGDIIPGATGGSIVWNPSFRELEYNYWLDDAAPPENAVRIFRLAIDAADVRFDGQSKRWDSLIQSHEKSFEDMTGAEVLSLVEEAWILGLTCAWDTSVDAKLCTVSILLKESEYGSLHLKLKIEYK